LAILNKLFAPHYII